MSTLSFTKSASRTDLIGPERPELSFQGEIQIPMSNQFEAATAINLFSYRPDL